MAWAQLPALPSTKPTHTVLLVGRMAPGQTTAAPLPLLKSQLQQAGKNSSLVFVGNPFTPFTLPGVAAPDRARQENQLKTQLDYLQGYKGQLIIIPGGHDGKGRVVQDVRNQERFIEQYLQKKNLFLPDNHCPGPAEVSLTEDLHLILLDPQWVLPNRRMDEDEEKRGCPTVGFTTTLATLDDILRMNEDKNLLMVMSVPPAMKKLEHTLLHRQLSQFYSLYRGLVHVEGNSLALQHQVKDSINYVGAGIGAKNVKSIKGATSAYADENPGFIKLLYFANGETWLEIWTAPTLQSASGQVAYRALIARKPTLKQVEEQVRKLNLNFAGQTRSLPASTYYNTNSFKHWLMGLNYRNEWKEPVALPVFDIATMHGGLKVIKRGGGFQTKSLRLTDSTGREYVLRSVEKYPDAALPRILRETLAADVVRDQISASHPYGALVAAPLAEAAGVYHTNPQYFIIPDDPRFGRYLKGFANTIGLFETRPDEDLSDLDSFGNTKNAVGTPKVLEKIQEDQDDQIDEVAVLKARLLDFFIADWDRHDDQWRWAEFKKKSKGSVYKPIPRDRDQAFFVNQGVIPNIASRKWILPKVQGFDERLRDIEGFNFNARHFDRTFLTSLERSQWLAMADSLEQSLTDVAIENAVKQLPPAVYQQSGATLTEKLKKRRAHLKEDADKYYLFLARKVDVVGTDQKDYFDVVRQPDGSTTVSIYKKTPSAEHLFYRRRFLDAETNELRLYGLGGDDTFKITGQAQKTMRIRIIGGEDHDIITDSSTVDGLRRLTYVYDTPDGATLNLGTEARDLTSKRPPVYDRFAYKYNYLGPLGSAEYNRDDGFLLGAGVQLRTQGFQKDPYGMMQRIMGSYAFSTKSFLVDYAAHFPQVRLGLDLKINANWKSPGYAENFFGLGNESTYDRHVDIDEYRYQSTQFYSNLLVGRQLSEYESIFVGPAYQTVNVTQRANRSLPENPNAALEGYYLPHAYAGARLEYVLDSRDAKAMPAKGIFWNVSANLLQGIKKHTADVAQVNSQFAIYKTFRIPFKLTLATRFGGGHTFGDNAAFFQKQTLDGPSTLRGYRRNRFTGHSTVYNNTEARLRLFSFTTYLFPASVGVFGFHDVGRVWAKDEDSKKWHQGYGGGVWLSPLNQIVLSAGYATSAEENLLLVRAGFQF